jgi:hypothetical protein
MIKNRLKSYAFNHFLIDCNLIICLIFYMGYCFNCRYFRSCKTCTSVAFTSCGYKNLKQTLGSASEKYEQLQLHIVAPKILNHLNYVKNYRSVV